MLSVNFVDLDHNRIARRKTVIFASLFALTVGLLAAGGAAASYRSVNRGTSVWTEFGRLPVISEISRAIGVEQDNSGLSTKKDDQYLNILILGIGGAGHDGALLTDTILFASVDLKERKAGIVSIPRDFAYPLGGGRYEKINSVHAYLEQANPGEGAIKTAEEFSRFFETPIDHVIRVDFRGFASLIDALGGIEVDVERSFVDAQYPTTDDLWMTIAFKKGKQTMSGERALQFVRSRHGSNGEGSDFARSKRQQLVILAVREKLLSLGTLANPAKIGKLFTTLTSNVQTDLSAWDVIALAPLFESLSSKNVVTHVMTDAPEGLLETGYAGDAYVLYPKRGDMTPVKALLQNPFQSEASLAAANAPVPPLAQIEVRNGTLYTGLATIASDYLKGVRIETTAIGNAAKRNYSRTIVFDLTSGKKSEALANLRSKLDAQLSLSPVAQNEKGERYVYADGLNREKITGVKIDFFVILGENTKPILLSP